VFKRTETIKFSDFMSGEYKNPKTSKKPNLKAIATGTMLPLILTPKAFAAESVQAIPTAGIADKAAGEIIAAMAHLFDPIIDLVVTISFPVASAMIVFKLFMGFFRDQGEVWEGIGKVSLVYILIQMSPIFINILKQLGTLAVGI
jgi:hypothetical protein